MNWQVNYPKYCLLAAARQSNRQQVTQDWEESCVALDVRHWWRDRGALAAQMSHSVESLST